MSHNITVEGGTSVRLLTAGKYCTDDIIVTATGGGGSTPVVENRWTHSGTVSTTTVGSGKYAVLATDPILAQHKDDATLFIRVEFDIAPTAYTIKKTWATNTIGYAPFNTTQYQWIYRYDASSAMSLNNSTSPINVSGTPAGIGSLQITDTGELRIYSNSSSNYAIRPSNYTIIVEW